MGLLCSS